MKQIRFLLSLAILFAVVLVSGAQASVSSLAVDATTLSNWRTAAALEADNEYGTDGYIVYGLNVADAQYVASFNTAVTNTAQNAVSLPSYISDITLAGAINMWSGNAANFGEIEDPGAGNALTNTSLLAGAADMTFTITRSSEASFRLVIIVADGDGAGVTYTTSVDDGSGGQSLTYSHTQNGPVYHVYDITAGTSDVVVVVDADNNNFNATGFAFDTFGGVGPHNPAPADDPDGTGTKVAVENVELSWNTAIGPDEQPLTTVKKHYVLGTFDDPSDPNLYLVDEVLVGTPGEATASYAIPNGTLVRDEVYQWQIIEGVDDGAGGVYPYNDTNNIAGPVWTFYSALSIPDIDQQTPADQSMFADETAVFMVDAINPFTSDSTGLEYQWYENDVLMIGETATTLTLTSVTEAMNGNTYYCKVTITSNGAKADSRTALLTVKQCVYHWPLDGDAVEANGSGFDGTLEGGTVFAVNNSGDPNENAVVGTGAAQFDGVDDFINCGNVPVMASGAMSISFWTQPKDIAADWKGMVAKWDESGNTFWIGQHSTDGMLNYSTYLPGETRNTPAGVLANNEWSFFVCTFDGQYQRTYWNGEIVASVEVTPTLDDLAGDLMFGQVPAGANFFNGLIDDVRIYNYALTNSEVASIVHEIFPDVRICERDLALNGASPLGLADINNDCVIDLLDFANLAAVWMECNLLPETLCP